MLLKNRPVSPLKSHSRRNSAWQAPTRSPLRSPVQEKTVEKSFHEGMDLMKGTVSNKAQLKAKDTMGILYSLEEIYQMLNFNDFDAFAEERIS